MEAGYGAEEQAPRRARRAGERERDLAANEGAGSTARPSSSASSSVKARN